MPVKLDFIPEAARAAPSRLAQQKARQAVDSGKQATDSGVQLVLASWLQEGWSRRRPEFCEFALGERESWHGW